MSSTAQENSQPNEVVGPTVTPKTATPHLPTTTTTTEVIQATPPKPAKETGKDSSEVLGISLGSMYFPVRFRVTIPDNADPILLESHTSHTVDRVKRDIISQAGDKLKSKSSSDYILAISASELLEVEYRKIAVAYEKTADPVPENSEPFPLFLLLKSVVHPIHQSPSLSSSSSSSLSPTNTTTTTSPSKFTRSVQFVYGPLATTPPSRAAAEIGNCRNLLANSPLSRVLSSPEIRRPIGGSAPNSPLISRGSPLIPKNANEENSDNEENDDNDVESDNEDQQQKQKQAIHANSVSPLQLNTPIKKKKKKSETPNPDETKKKHRKHHKHKHDKLTDNQPTKISSVPISASFGSNQSALTTTTARKHVPLPECFSVLNGLNPLISVSEGYILDPLSNIQPTELTLDQHLLMDDPELFVPWYSMYIKPAECHWNYVGECSNSNKGDLIVVSVCAANEQQTSWRVLLRCKTGDIKRIIETTKPSKQPPIKDLCKIVAPDLKIKSLTLSKSTESGEAALLHYEDRQRIRSFKFGVVFAKASDSTEEQMFGNSQGNSDYDDFLTILGEKIKLIGWQQYRAGLDNKSNNTGEESVYTVFRGLEIMYHVSTMLPKTQEEQQVERKRHIGNDIGVIVFKEQGESSEPFRSDTFRSEFNHVFAVVQKVGKLYRVEIVNKDGVKPYGPKSPTPFAFENTDLFREFLLCKLINGEISAYSAPGFKHTIQRTRAEFIKDLAESL